VQDLAALRLSEEELVREASASAAGRRDAPF